MVVPELNDHAADGARCTPLGGMGFVGLGTTTGRALVRCGAW
jgi:hypothetical protein